LVALLFKKRDIKATALRLSHFVENANFAHLHDLLSAQYIEVENLKITGKEKRRNH